MADANSSNKQDDRQVQVRTQVAVQGDIATGPRPVENEREAGLLALLQLENDARDAASEGELISLIANETRKITRARQVFVLAEKSTGLHIVGVSGVATADRNAPLLQWIERTAAALKQEAAFTSAKEFNLSGYTASGELSAATYPMKEALWVPFKTRTGTVFAGMILTRELVWQNRDVIVSNRIAKAYAHSWQALRASPRIPWRQYFTWRRAGVALAAVMCTLFLPVSLTTLAPVEVAPRDGFIVTAPIEGVIEQIAVEPNSTVQKGRELVRFVDTTLRSRFEVAEREVLVAEARLKKTTQLAFADESGRHEMGLARAELALKIEERNYTRDQLEKSKIVAQRDGIAVFSDKSDLVGRPITIGERIMEIADPGQVEFRIDVPASDSIVLKNGARAKLFLDSSPLRPLEASVIRADYQARVRGANVLSYRVIASVAESETSTGLPRIGVRGTAQLYGNKVPLGLYLFRRPISALRQSTGL